MKIAYLCTDLGIPVLGSKGASIHIREFSGALVELGHEVQIYTAVGSDPRAPVAAQNGTRAPLTVLAPSVGTADAAIRAASALARLGGRNAARHLRSELRHLLA